MSPNREIDFFNRPALILPLILALGCATAPVPATPETAARDGYRIRRLAPGLMVVDGEPTESAWRHASAMDRFQTAGPMPAHARVSTAARLVCDSAALYVFFTCQVERFTVVDGERDAELWNGEAAEIFLCPFEEPVPYFEFVVNPHGGIYDSKIADWRYESLSRHWREWAQAFNAPITVATKVIRDKDGNVTAWQAEVAIPFQALGLKSAPPPGATWRFNVFRAAGLAAGGIEYSAWRPTFGDFHRPLTFPCLRFE